MIMKKSLLLLISGIALLLAGCTTETETRDWVNKDGKITRIYVEASSEEDAVEPTTRTTTNGNSVTWVTGDEIALFETTGQRVYKRFRLVSDPGTKSGYFEGVGTDDYLTPGTSYRVVYPYSAAQYTGSNVRYRKDIQAFMQTDNSNSNLTNDDWLISEIRTVTDGTMPGFRLNHCFALLEVSMQVEGIEEDDDYEMYFSNFTIETSGNELAFANKVYITDDGNLGVSSYQNSIVVSRTDKPWFENGTYKFWYVVKANPSVGIAPLVLHPYFTQGSSVLWSVKTEFTPTSVLQSGKYYHLNLKMTYNNVSPSASTLTVVGR